MEIIVTGATGFLGKRLCEMLEDVNHEVTRLSSKNCDLTKPESLNNWNDQKYDQIYHLAAWTQAGDFCLSHPGEQWIINQYINTNVLHWWQQYQPQAKLICMGTSCVYDPALPLVEENYLVGTPIDSLFTYAMTKRMLYVGLVALQKQYGLNYLCIVPSTLYGPGYHTDGRQMHFIFDLIRKIIRGKEYGDPVVLWGDGKQRRELVYIDDFVGITIRLSNMVDNELINVGAGEEMSIRYFAEQISHKVNYDIGALQFDTARYVGARSKCLDIKKLRQLIADLTYTSLDEGLDKTIQWFMKEKEKLLSVS